MWEKLGRQIGHAAIGGGAGAYVLGQAGSENGELLPIQVLLTWGLCGVAGFFWAFGLNQKDSEGDDGELPVNAMMTAFFIAGFTAFYMKAS